MSDRDFVHVILVWFPDSDRQPELHGTFRKKEVALDAVRGLRIDADKWRYRVVEQPFDTRHRIPQE